MTEFGCQSMALPLRRVVMRRPGDSLRRADPALWHYGPGFEADRAIAQYADFAHLVQSAGPDILWLEDDDDGLADAMFTHDPSLMTEHGAILLSMGKALRHAEVDLHARAYRDAGIPILGRIVAPGTAEGGDCVWLDRTTLLVGREMRTNQAGIDQLSALLAPHGILVLAFDLPLWQGEDACLHLMSIVSPLDAALALVHAPLLPVALYQALRAAGVALVTAPADEFAASTGLSLNVLPTAPRAVIMVDGFSGTRAALEAAGCTVSVFAADALCIACEGGPTCLTRPILRRAA